MDDRSWAYFFLLLLCLGWGSSWAMAIADRILRRRHKTMMAQFYAGLPCLGGGTCGVCGRPWVECEGCES